MARSRPNLASRYDAGILDPEVRRTYDGTDFYNLGDWGPHPAGPPEGLGEAAHRLVEMHLRADDDDEAKRSTLVLDVGCGLGAGAAMFGAHYPQALVVGINFSPVQSLHCAGKVAGARFAVMDAARMAIAPGCADRVHSVEAAFHFDSRDDFLGEVRRILRPGGKAIVTDILFRRPFGFGIPARNIWVGEDEYAARCGRAGLEVEALEDITDRTLKPFCAFVNRNGLGLRAGPLERAADAYVLAVLRKPAD